MRKQSAITYLKEQLVMWLDEVWKEYCQGNKTDFLLGQIYAYVECLEVLMQCEGVDNQTQLDIETRYGLR